MTLTYDIDPHTGIAYPIVIATYDDTIDSFTGQPYPNMCDKNYLKGSIKIPPNFDEHMFFTTLATDSYKTHVLVPYRNVSYIPLWNITIKYFYIVNTFNVKFYDDMRDVGFSHIDSKIIEDANAGNCKIILIQDVEGMSGLVGTFHEYEFRTIQEWCTKANLNPKAVHYICGNLISDKRAQEQGCTYNVHPITTQETWNNITSFPLEVTKFEPSQPNYLYLNYNRQSRFHRVCMLSKLIKHELFDKGMNSFNTMGRKFDEFEYRLEDFEPGLSLYGQQLFDRAPIFVDTDNSKITSSVGDLSNYTDTFISLISETLTEPGTLFCSEKTWRSIIVGHPFMILGSTNALKYLKSQGFKTFSDWVDESYDDYDDLDKKVNIIVSNLERFSKMTVDELKKIRDEMEPTLIHNKNHMREYSKNKYYYQDTYSHKKPVEMILDEIWINLLGEDA